MTCCSHPGPAPGNVVKSKDTKQAHARGPAEAPTHKAKPEPTQPPHKSAQRDVHSAEKVKVSGHTVCHEHSEPQYEPHVKLFMDPEFPPSPESLGNDVPMPVGWYRAADLNRGAKEVLWGEIHPTDIRQGELGDCWLIAAIASLAEYPEFIKGAFQTTELNPHGKYLLRLWDVREGIAGDWVSIVVDDFIPCALRLSRQKAAKPLYSSFCEEGKIEIWPMMLEKAFAKFVGSYANLASGDPAWAWQAMGWCTDLVLYERYPGGGVWSISHNDVHLQRHEFAFQEESRRWLAFVDIGQSVDHDGMLEHMMRMKVGRNIIATSICPQEEQDSAQGHNCDAASMREKGLVQGHQFSLLFIAQVTLANGTPLYLVLQRNPWANSVIWNGAWGPKSYTWTKHPEVKQQLEQKAGDVWSQEETNGEFWMSWTDFKVYFTDITVCHIDGWQEEL